MFNFKINFIKISRFLLIHFVFVFVSCSNVLADLKIIEWQQQNNFNEIGQEVEIFVKLKAVKLNENYYHNSWSYIFPKSEKINIIEAKVINSNVYKSTFGGNILKIEFNKLFNNEEIILRFKYQTINDSNKKKYIRQEWVQIPKFVAGAKAKLVVKPLQNMDVYSSNELFNIDYDNTYKWAGIVGNNGIAELFQMTLKEATWKVSTIINITNNIGSLNKLKVLVPINYIGGNNEIINYNVSNNQINYADGKIIKMNKDNIEINFLKYQHNSGFIKIEAEIKNNYNNFYWSNNFDINDTLKIKQEYLNIYNSLINEIKNTDTINSPVYIKIAKWVNKNITYDKRYIGKQMTSMEILKTKRGVCEHYSILYQDLLRSIGIPAKTISGISYSYNDEKFENHAWVMVNHNGQWIPVDPTWGIYSGKLPISHIFLYNDIRKPIEYSMQTSLDGVVVDIINNAEYLDNKLIYGY